jgi:uncharacterized protein YndB with AHSA1/START domain
MSPSQTGMDRIEKQVRLKAPRARVWRALTDMREFGTWFGVNLTVETVEPEKLFSFRWHPYAIDPNMDYSSEPTTLVAFTLEDADGGTPLTVVESGFDRIPASRRAKAFEMNSGGWAAQMENIERHLSG